MTLVCLLLASASAFAQTKTVTGTVTDAANEPLIGASVLVQGTSTGTITGTDVRMRASYSTDSAVLGYFDNGETVTVLDDVTSEGQRWLKGQRSEGSVGWVSADFCAQN